MKTDYDSMASVYARNRRASDIVIDELSTFAGLGPASMILEVGCGTASHVIALINATGCRGWGIEPSDGMRRRAPSHQRLKLAEGAAEAIPFDADSFDLVFSVNVIHHVSDPRAHFREAVRVLASGGRLCTVTDSTEMIRNRKPLSQYWPSSAEADIKRYPTIDALFNLMGEVGLVGRTTREIRTAFAVTDATPYRERAFSCLHMISDEDFEEGLVRLEADLQKGSVDGIGEYVCVWGKVP